MCDSSCGETAKKVEVPPQDNHGRSSRVSGYVEAFVLGVEDVRGKAVAQRTIPRGVS